MKFQFESLQAFLHMDGHGVFVWACYAVSCVVMISLLAVPYIERKKFARKIQGQLKRQQAQPNNGGQVNASSS